jgi:hypothetical protein
MKRLTDEARRELERQRAAIEAEAAKLRELYDALADASEEVEPNEQP